MFYVMPPSDEVAKRPDGKVIDVESVSSIPASTQTGTEAGQTTANAKAILTYQNRDVKDRTKYPNLKENKERNSRFPEGVINTPTSLRVA